MIHILKPTLTLMLTSLPVLASPVNPLTGNITGVVQQTFMSETRTAVIDRAMKLKLKTRDVSRVVVLEDGTYDNIKVTLSGSKDAPLILKASNPGNVIFTGDTHIQITGSYVVLSGIRFKHEHPTTDSRPLVTVNGSHNRLTQSSFDSVDGPEIVSNYKSAWVGLRGDHNRIDHSSFRGKMTRGNYINVTVSKYKPGNHIIDFNYFTRQPLGKNGASAIRVGHGSVYNYPGWVTIENNLFQDQSGESEIISFKSSENVVRGNTFRVSRGALSLRQGYKSLVYDNFFIGNGTYSQGGIFIRGGNHIIFNNHLKNLHPRRNQGVEGVISLGSASDIDQKRINRGLNGRHFPLTRKILIIGNTIENSENYGIVLNAQYGTRSRNTLPQSIYLINNIISGADQTAIYGNKDEQKNLLLNNQFKLPAGHPNSFKTCNPSAEPYTPLVTTVPSAQPPISETTLTKWLGKLFLNKKWEENTKIVARLKQALLSPSNQQEGFCLHSIADGLPKMPLTAKDVGPDWESAY